MTNFIWKISRGASSLIRANLSASNPRALYVTDCLPQSAPPSCSTCNFSRNIAFCFRIFRTPVPLKWKIKDNRPNNASGSAKLLREKIVIIIQFSSVLLVCCIKSQKTNYRCNTKEEQNNKYNKITTIRLPRNNNNNNSNTYSYFIKRKHVYINRNAWPVPDHHRNMSLLNSEEWLLHQQQAFSLGMLCSILD
jgi:hypothetical protein